MSDIVIAIDGPVGVGKSTVAKEFAKKLNFFHLDSGAMYRCVTLEVSTNNYDINNKEDISHLLQNFKINLIPTDSGLKIICNDKDVTENIRTEEINRRISEVADKIQIRMKINELQRHIASGKKVVVEGRDIGTVVFPDAKYKFYLDAEVEERAKRRWNEFKGKGANYDYEKILKSVIERDERDKGRPFGALKKADDAIVIDTTNMNVTEVVDKLISCLDRKDIEK